ncbi:MAG: hypothetical protein ACYS76_12410, partial [Planctomycetota bacterium]
MRRGDETTPNSSSIRIFTRSSSSPTATTYWSYNTILSVDKDGYDYENRIVKITKDGNHIAGFAYDALGRRIEKKDSIAGTTTHYYYNDKWQVLVEYDGGGTPKDLFVYGNCRVLKADYADDPGGIGGGCFNWLRRR